MIIEDISSIIGRIKEVSEDILVNSIGLYVELLEKIGEKIHKMNKLRADLLFLRNLVIKNTSGAIKEGDNTFGEKRVLYHILDEYDLISKQYRIPLI